jgi:hypothetical protein
MKFNSLQEYFYKIQNFIFMLILVQLMAFIGTVVGPLATYEVPGLDKTQAVFVACFVSATAVIGYVWATFLFRKNTGLISKLIGLSLKLERYYYATLWRYSVGTLSGILVTFGFLLTRHIAFIGLYGFFFFLFFIAWPWPSKVCRDLKLKGDEKEMVLYKKHTL